VDKRSLWQRKALKGSRLRLLIWGVLAAFLVVAISHRPHNPVPATWSLGAAVDTILGKGRGSFLSSWDGLHEAPVPIIPGAAWQGENQRCHSLRPLFGSALPWV
jgi:hypothetical protein